MLDLKEISYQPQTGERKIIENLNLKVHENEIILICGNSGSGKTTLLEIISGLTNPQKGKITWKNKILSSRQRRWFCGVVFQFPERYFVGTTVGKELKIGHKSLREKNIEIVLNKVGLKKINLTQPPEQLSGGQQRRLAVAVQLLRNPSILLLDEPTAGLDPIASSRIEDLINKTNNKASGSSIVVSHVLSTIERTSDKVLMLYGGKFRWAGSIDEFKKSKDPYVFQFRNGKLDGPMQPKDI